jgi:serine/threonine protein kinase
MGWRGAQMAYEPSAEYNRNRQAMSWTHRVKTLLFGSPTAPDEVETVREAAAKPLENTGTVTLVTSGSDDLVSARWRTGYRVVRELGEGGMGKVMLAERQSDGLPVCLKLLHADTDRATGEQECRALMRLRHPAIVALIDFSLQDSPPWLMTEFAPGQTLRRFLKERGLLDRETALGLLKTLFTALEYAHSRAVIHRDLKPENIMVDASVDPPAVRVLDFGIAIVDRVDHGGRITARDALPMGTVRYMAPEQFRGELLTPACDVYALGLIAWEMLSGRELFTGKKPHEMMFEKITRAGGYTLQDSSSAPAVEALNRLVEACTRPDPAARIAASAALEIISGM